MTAVIPRKLRFCAQAAGGVSVLFVVTLSLVLARPLPAISYTRTVPVEMPKQMRAWRYIVIHHSGSPVGNEEMIQAEHLRRGMENGMAYHFLIGNGSAGLGDGEVVEGHRWKYQLQGGHAHQDYLNECGIGICLVGNLNRNPPTVRQMQSLVQLVLKLQFRFHIPDDNIHGHGEFFGEDSECPGKMFDWTRFWDRLNGLYKARASVTPLKSAAAARPAGDGPPPP